MLGVLLIILKTIGIIILSLLLLVLVLLALVLFVPIRYKIYASYYGKLKFRLRLSYLFKLLRIRADYEDDFSYEGKIAFFRFLKSDNVDESIKNKDNESKDKDLKEKTVFDEFSDEEFDFTDTEENSNFNDTGENAEIGSNERTDSTNETNSEEVIDPVNSKEVTDEQALNEETLKENKSLITKLRIYIKKFLNKLREILRLISDSLRKVKGAKEKLVAKINKIMAIITDEENKEFAKFILLRVKELIKLIRPKKYKIDLHFGFEDPATTGKILMYLSVIYGLTGLDMKINPEFEEEIKEGEIVLKGSLQLFFVLIIAIKLLLNKKFKELVFK